jgi:hypothetical protein
MEKLLVSKEEARIAVGYGRRSWDAVIASGELPVIRHGTRIFISTEAVENFAKADRPRMAPRPASHPSESASPPASEGNEPLLTAKVAHSTRSEREGVLRRRRARMGQF